MTDVSIVYHGHCFDGMASAALLTRLLRDTESKNLSFQYRGLDHQPGGSFVPDSVLTGDINAVVDFRYSTSDRLHWWFDHHVSGIIDQSERDHFDADTSGLKFYDPQCSSCCKLIAQVGRSDFNWEPPELADLVQWADLIDAARFPDAETAIRLRDPALQLMTVIEVHGDDAFLAPRIEKLARGTTVKELAEDAQVQSLFLPLAQAHEQACETIRERAVEHDGVVFVDMADIGTDRYNKFVPYWLFPQSRYCVVVSQGKTRAKVSVGSNPWSPIARSHDISAICEQYGGGGHPVVGAVSLGPDQIGRAREIAVEIRKQLQA